MRVSVKFTSIALISLAGSALSLAAFAQQTGGSGTNNSTGGTTLRSWCQQEGNRAMCQQAKADREAQKSACQGQAAGGQSNDGCQQARTKLKSDMQAMHQAGAPEARRGRRGGGTAGGGGDETGAE